MKKYLCILGLIIVLFFVTTIVNVNLSFNDHTYTITVTDKERIMNKDSDSKYLVYGDDENGNSLVFENTDTTLRGK